MISYLSVRQYVSVNRIEEFMQQFFGLELKGSTVCNKLEQSRKKLLSYYSWIKKQLSESGVVGSDETGCRVNGRKGWMWTWQTNKLTYLRYSDNRGQRTISTVFPNGLPKSIMVHDCYTSSGVCKKLNDGCKTIRHCTNSLYQRQKIIKNAKKLAM